RTTQCVMLVAGRSEHGPNKHGLIGKADVHTNALEVAEVMLAAAVNAAEHALGFACRADNVAGGGLKIAPQITDLNIVGVSRGRQTDRHCSSGDGCPNSFHVMSLKSGRPWRHNADFMATFRHQPKDCGRM